MILKKRIKQSVVLMEFWVIGILIFLSGSVTSFAQTGTLVTSVEAESGVLFGGLTKSTSIAGYSGTGYITNFRNAPDSLSVTVNVPKAAFYSILIRYNSGDNKYQRIDVNGTGASDVYFPKSNGWANADAGKFFLHSGDNRVTIENSWGWVDIDQFLVYTTALNAYDKIVPELVDPKASAATKSLYYFLLSQYGKRIISGQTDGYTSDIITITGKTPMYRVSDFQHYTEGYSYKGGGFGWDDNGNTESMINWYNSTGKKGIVGFQWHWHSPSGGVVNTNTFYTANTTFDVTKAVQKGTIEYAQTIRDIDSIATQLRKLEKANVPVLWRPLHEAGGGWFWWGAKGGAACKQLYAILYDRLTNYHQIHNLIWVWSTYETDWYPGNEKVDIVGHDSYPGNYNYGTQKNTFDRYFNLTGGKKIVTMSENGPIPNPDDCLAYDAPWSYFMSWYDLVLSQNSTQHLKDVYNNPRVLTLENDIFPMILSTTNASVCGSGSAILGASANFGAVNWYNAETGGTLLHTGISFTTPVLSVPTTYYVEASYNGQPSEIKRIAVKATFSTPVVNASAISGTSIVCQGANNVAYSLNADANVDSYLWILPSGAIVVGDGTKNSILVNFGGNAQSGNIIAKGRNACGDGPENTFAVTVNSLPAAAGKITGLSLLCKNIANNVLYSVPEIAGTTSYVWTLPSGATGTSTTNQISVNFGGSAVGSVSIKVKGQNDCGTGVESALAVVVNSGPADAGKISGSTSICRGSGKVVYSIQAITGATSYAWTLSSGLTGTSTTRIISVSFDNATVNETIKVSGHNDCGDGEVSTLSVTVNDIPATPEININNRILQSNAPVGNQWYYNYSMITSAISDSYNASRTGDYYTIVTLHGCSSEPSNTVSVFPTGVGPELGSEIYIYPNPVERGEPKITISGLNVAENASVRILDVNGKLVFSGKITGQPIELDKSIDAGIYLIQLISGEKNYTEKFVVK